ncbi:hypothetical protein E2562_029438 [Oryza meyeriana var. granulata]|uniref:Uncharacterized protein n=1 Tax=Oryza meyeriana var. granulata TaxID=110450 RepID=A0A6G1E2T6_9ORYZ|nr:hypothetical protein E2562_029438 [Oryza meyeriana var. granulata]
MASDEGDWLYELLDPEIDAHHHSFLSTVQPPHGQPMIELTTLPMDSDVTVDRRSTLVTLACYRSSVWSRLTVQGMAAEYIRPDATPEVDAAYWLTHCRLIFDVQVEEYAIHRSSGSSVSVRSYPCPTFPDFTTTSTLEEGSSNPYTMVTTQEVLCALGRIIDRTAHAIRVTSCLHPQQVVKPVVAPQFRLTGMTGSQYFLFGQHAPQFEEDFAHIDVEESDRHADDYFVTDYWLTTPT